MESVRLVASYGEAKRGVSYRVLEHGYDFVRISVDGTPIYVPKNLVGKSSDFSMFISDETDEEDEEWEGDW